MRQTANFWARAFWIDRDSHPKVAAGDLLVQWTNAIGRTFWKRWPRLLFIGVILALAANGFLHLRKDARDWAARHWMPAGGFLSSSFSLLSHGLGLPAPQIALAGYAPGHKFHLVWNPVAPGISYQVLSSCGYAGRRNAYFANLDKPVTTPGAMVDLNHNGCNNPAALEVRSVAPNADESPLSNPIVVTLTEDNANNTVDPLESAEAVAIQAAGNGGGAAQGAPPNAGNQNGGTGTQNVAPAGRKPGPIVRHDGSRPVARRDDVSANSVPAAGATGGTAPSAAPLINSNDATQLMQAGLPQNGGIVQRFGNALAIIAGKSVTSGTPSSAATGQGASASYPGPANLQWKLNPDKKTITLTWQDMGAGYHYNLYASYANDNPSFDRDGYLLRQASTPWFPPTKGVQVFIFYVTAVNPQGQESAPSDRILADLRQ